MQFCTFLTSVCIKSAVILSTLISFSNIFDLKKSNIKQNAKKFQQRYRKQVLGEEKTTKEFNFAKLLYLEGHRQGKEKGLP